MSRRQTSTLALAHSQLLLAAIILLAALSACTVLSSDASKTKAADLSCGACRAVSRALLTGVRGDAGKKLPQARRIADLLEVVCRRLPGHGRMQHPDKPDRWGIVPLSRDDDKPVDLERLDADPGLGNWLRMRCEDLLDDREDDVTKLLLKLVSGGGGGSSLSLSDSQLEKSLCSELASLCQPDQLSLRFEPPVDPIAASGAQKLDLDFAKGGEL